MGLEGGALLKRNHTSALYGTLLLTVIGFANQLLGFLYRIFLSRMVGAEVMGLYQLVMPAYAVLMSLTSVGLTAAVSTLTSEYQALGNRRAERQLLRRCLFLFLLLLTLPALLTALFSDSVSVYILGDARTRLGLLVLLPCVLLTGVENIHKHAFYGAGMIRPPAFTEFLEQAVRALSVLGLLALFLPQNPERTVGLIVTGMVLCEVFSVCALAFLYRRWQNAFSGPEGAGVPSRILNHRIVHIALPIAATSLLGNLMGSACAVLIPQKLVEGGMEVSEAISAFGVMFGMSLPLLGLPTAFIGALGLMLTPRLAESTALGRKKATHRRISGALLATSVLILPATVFLTVLGPTLGVLLFREPTVGDYLIPLSAGMVLSCYQAVLSASLNGVGRHTAAARNALISGAVELGAVFFTVGLPGVGLGGFAAAFVLSSSLGALLNAVSLHRSTGLKPKLFQWFTAPGLSALLMGLNVNLLFHILQDRGLSSLGAMAACLPFGLVLYLAALSVQGVELLRFRELF